MFRRTARLLLRLPLWQRGSAVAVEELRCLGPVFLSLQARPRVEKVLGCWRRSNHAASLPSAVTSTKDGALGAAAKVVTPPSAEATVRAAETAPEGGKASTQQQRRRRSKLEPRPLAPGVADFLAARAVNPEQLAAALPLRAPQLPLAQVQATWQLLGQDYGIPDADLAQLLQKVPAYLGADVEGLRSKLDLLGVRGEPLARLLGVRNLVYVKAASLRPLLARLEHYVGAAASVGLLPPGTSLRALMTARPGSWAEALACSPARVEAVFAALHSRASMDDAQLGAAVAGFPAILKYSQAGIMDKCDALARVLGSPREASALISAAPAVLMWSPATAQANVAFLRQDLGWSAAQVGELVRSNWRTFGTPLTSPGLQRVLQLCESVLCLPPSAMLAQHASTLVCSPEAAVPRLEFVGSRGLRRASGCTRFSARFLKDTAEEWARRLRCWGVPQQEWEGFEAAYWQGLEGRALRRDMAAADALRAAGASAAAAARSRASLAAGRGATVVRKGQRRSSQRSEPGARQASSRPPG